MAQRASHYQSLHTELLDKVSQATDTEKEVICPIYSSLTPFLNFFLCTFSLTFVDHQLFCLEQTNMFFLWTDCPKV